MEWIMEHWWIGLLSIPLGFLGIMLGTIAGVITENRDSLLVILIGLVLIVLGWIGIVVGQVWLVLSLVVWIVLQFKDVM